MLVFCSRHIWLFAKQLFLWETIPLPAHVIPVGVPSRCFATVVPPVFHLPDGTRFWVDHVTQAGPIKIFLIFDIWTQEDRGSSFPNGSHKDTTLAMLAVIFLISFLNINPFEREKKKSPSNVLYACPLHLKNF